MNKRNLIIFVIFFSFIFISQDSYAWLSGWNYRKPITINNTQNSNTLTDHQVAINVSYENGKMNSDFSDLRFTNSSDSLLPYWIESKVDGAWAYVWVKVPYIPASSTTTIYVYYGNTTPVSSESNAEATLIQPVDLFIGTRNDWNSTIWNQTVVRTAGLPCPSGNRIQDDWIENDRGYLKSYCSGNYYHEYGKGTKEYKDFSITGMLSYRVRFYLNSSQITTNDNRQNFVLTPVYTDTEPGMASDNIYLYYFYMSTYKKWSLEKRVGGTTTSIATLSFNPDNNFHTVRIDINSTHARAYIDNTLFANWFTHSTTKATAYLTALGNNVEYKIHNWDWIYVVKMSDPEPTYSIGAEELPSINQPPQIIIFSPANVTYWFANNFNFTFKVTDDNSTTFWVKAFLDNVLQYENTSYQNDTVVTFLKNLTLPKRYNFTVWANDTQGATTSLTVIFTIKDFEIQQIIFNQFAYETSDQNYSIIFRVNFDLVQNITTELWWQYYGSNIESWNVVFQNMQTKNETHLNNSAGFILPLIRTNSTIITFRFRNIINYINETLTENFSSDSNQTIIFAYWIDSIASDRNDYIEFEDAIIKLYVKDKIGRATVSARLTFVYNSTHNVSQDISSYTANQDLKIFNYTFDTLESFSDNETRNYFANLTISFQGKYRIMNSLIQQLKVYRIILTNCSIYPTKALTFFVKDEETDNSLANATVEATFDVWKTGEIKRNYAWRFYLENRDNQSVCIYPDWAEYTIDSMIQYYKTGYQDRTYFIHANISNSTTGTNLYLLDVNLGSIIIVYVRDENGNKVQNAIVKIQRYYVGSNSYKTVAQVRTDYEGKGVTFLRVNEIYYRFIIERNFVVLRETQPTIITCTSGGCPPYTVTLSISEQMPAKYFQYLGKIAYSCQLNEETNVLKCTVDDTSQLMQKARLLVEQKGALKFDTLCDNICESSACTLTCDLGNRTNKLYRYQLFAYFSEPPIVLEQKVLDYLTGIIFWGSQGLLIGFILVSTLFFVGIWNPVVAMIFAFLGIIVGYVLGMIPVSVFSLVGLGLAIGILIYKMRL
jgi:hypothetical protein